MAGAEGSFAGSELIIAGMAFAGATIAQLLDHYLQARREDHRRKQEQIGYIDCLIADLTHTALQFGMVLLLLKTSDDEGGWWDFDGSGDDIQLVDLSATMFHVVMPVHPSVVHRVRRTLGFSAELLLSLKQGAPGKLDDATRLRMIDLLVYCLKLAILLENAKSTRTVGYVSDITDEQAAAKWSEMRITTGRLVQPSGLFESWVKDLAAARAARSAGDG